MWPEVLQLFILQLALCMHSGFSFHAGNKQFPVPAHLPVGLLAQLVQHCTGSTEVMGLTPTQDNCSVHFCLHF